ncbi:MAG: DUF2493 domain-containing protein [Clostridia bacterium]|nr:DUF2493 domain-containing protein [Clostridia bacterium]MBQ4612827.1 DUF2493 domain-containing protein [Clostridia bacterium]
MKIAVVGSRGLQVEELGQYLPAGATEIVSGGAKGVDRCAADYALAHHWSLTEFLPQYNRYGRGAPIRRNNDIVAYADHVLVFWDGVSHGAKYVIDRCRKTGKPVTVFLWTEHGFQEQM